MAGDWIKMRVELKSHPKVVRILSAIRPHDVQTKSDAFRIVGGLHAVWTVFDTHSVDGELRGYTPEIMDETIGWPGFSEAMMSVGWLIFDGGETLTMPDFEAHNGKSAKRRAEDAKRKKYERSNASEICPENVQNLSKKNRTREQESINKKLTKENDDVPHEEIIELFHAAVPDLPQIRGWTDARKKLLRARWEEEPKRQNLDWWKRFFEYVDKSDYLCGRSASWKADLPWILKQENFLKVIEGRYHTDGTP
jgi:hypothetical protein